MKKITKYSHHGQEVSVMRDNKGKHVENCLCWQNCKHFKPGEKDNCRIANLNYALCLAFNLVTPVWECPEYENDQRS